MELYEIRFFLISISKSAEAVYEYSCMPASLLHVSVTLKESFCTAKMQLQRADVNMWENW